MLLELNTKSESFDVALEILCTLPREPYYVRMGDLAADFGLESQKVVYDRFDDLLIHGIKVYTFNRKTEGRCACIQYRDWQKAMELAEKYWNKVNEKR